MLVLGLRCTWSAGGRCQHSWAQPRGGSWPLPREVALARCLRIGFQARSFLFQTNFFIFLNIQGLNWVSPNRFRMGCCSWEGCKRFCCKYTFAQTLFKFSRIGSFHLQASDLLLPWLQTAPRPNLAANQRTNEPPFSFLGPIKVLPGQCWDYYGGSFNIGGFPWELANLDFLP